MLIKPKAHTSIEAWRVTEDTVGYLKVMLYNHKILFGVYANSDLVQVSAPDCSRVNFIISNGDWLLIDSCGHLQQLTHEYVCANYTHVDGSEIQP
jgi:hypothetical protein